MTIMDFLGPAIGAGVFVLSMSFVREPTRRTLNAVIVAGASGVPQRRLRLLGGCVPTRGHARGLSSAELVPLYRPRMGHACRLGLAAPFLGQSDLAVHADIVVRVRDL